MVLSSNSTYLLITKMKNLNFKSNNSEKQLSKVQKVLLEKKLSLRSSKIEQKRKNKLLKIIHNNSFKNSCELINNFIFKTKKEEFQNILFEDNFDNSCLMFHRFMAPYVKEQI